MRRAQGLWVSSIQVLSSLSSCFLGRAWVEHLCSGLTPLECSWQGAPQEGLWTVPAMAPVGRDFFVPAVKLVCPLPSPLLLFTLTKVTGVPKFQTWHSNTCEQAGAERQIKVLAFKASFSSCVPEMDVGQHPPLTIITDICQGQRLTSFLPPSWEQFLI